MDKMIITIVYLCSAAFIGSFLFLMFTYPSYPLYKREIELTYNNGNKDTLTVTSHVLYLSHGDVSFPEGGSRTNVVASSVRKYRILHEQQVK